jgi:hypothetical protein
MGKNAVLLGGNWDNAANSGSRCSNWNNSPTISNASIGSRGVGEDEEFGNFNLRRCYGLTGWPVFSWSAMLYCFGEHLWGFGRAPSSHRVVVNGAANFSKGVRHG